ncbi:MAG: hypothetical protein Kow00106_02980 [Anaerolineae bacterium]
MSEDPRWSDDSGDGGPESPRRPMLPRRRRRVPWGTPQAIPRLPGDWDPEYENGAPRSRRQDLDPILGYILAMALSVGLTPLPANTRYVVLWGVLAIMGGMAFLLGTGIRLKVTDPGDLLWGLGLGLFAGGALMLAGTDALATAAERLFAEGDPQNPLLDTWIFQAAAFTMPVSEALFFRGAMQRTYSLPVVAVLASLWSMLMFFPNLHLSDTPAVGLVFSSAIALLNFLYGYVHWRHGLAASFFCQVTAGTLLLLVPRLLT